jgi:hypothetical protein
LYEYSFDELIEKVPYNAQDEKLRIELSMFPLLVARLSRQFKKSISYTECQIQATRLGCAKLQHDDRITRLINRSDQIMGSDGHIFAVHSLLKSVGYPYATFSMDGRFKITF